MLDSNPLRVYSPRLGGGCVLGLEACSYADWTSAPPRTLPVPRESRPRHPEIPSTIFHSSAFPGPILCVIVTHYIPYPGDLKRKGHIRRMGRTGRRGRSGEISLQSTAQLSNHLASEKPTFQAKLGPPTGYILEIATYLSTLRRGIRSPLPDVSALLQRKLLKDGEEGAD